MDRFEYAVKQLVELCNIPSPSGYTRAAIEYINAQLTGLGFAPTITRKGSLVCELTGMRKLDTKLLGKRALPERGELVTRDPSTMAHIDDPERGPCVLSAHVDTLGAMVRSIKPNGRLRYTHIGGYWDNSIENENCIITTRAGKVYSGTIQTVYASRHVFSHLPAFERTDETLEIVLDEIVHTQADVEALGISTGDIIAFMPRTVVTPSGYIKSRHLDDKASSALLLALAGEVSAGRLQLARKTYIMFTTYEEVGHGASAGMPEDVEELLVVDMGCVGDDLAGDETKVSICPKDSAGPFDYDMTSRLIRLARENELQYAVDVFPHYSSDSATALRAGRDITYGLIGPGVFASHGYERTHMQGMEATLRLMEAYVTER